MDWKLAFAVQTIQLDCNADQCFHDFIVCCSAISEASQLHNTEWMRCDHQIQTHIPNFDIHTGIWNIECTFYSSLHSDEAYQDDWDGSKRHRESKILVLNLSNCGFLFQNSQRVWMYCNVPIRLIQRLLDVPQAWWETCHGMWLATCISLHSSHQNLSSFSLV